MEERTKRAKEIYKKILNEVYKANIKQEGYSKQQITSIVSFDLTFTSNISLSPRGVESYVNSLLLVGALEYSRNKLLVITKKGCKVIGKNYIEVLKKITGLEKEGLLRKVYDVGES